VRIHFEEKVWTVRRQPPTATLDGGLWFRSDKGDVRFLPMTNDALLTAREVSHLTAAQFAYYLRLALPR